MEHFHLGLCGRGGDGAGTGPYVVLTKLFGKPINDVDFRRACKERLFRDGWGG